jgi:hypothetical protein
MAETWTDQGGFLANALLNKRFVHSAQPLTRFRQFVDVKDSIGKNDGETENWTKVANVGTIGGRLVETNTMIETTQAKTKGTLTMYENGNSIPYTFKTTVLSQLDIVKMLNTGLKDDMVKAHDGLVEVEFNKTKLRYVGTATAGKAVTTDGTATATNTSALNQYHIRQMVLELKKRNVPGYGSMNGDYAAIVSLEGAENLIGSLEATYLYTESGFKAVANGEVGRYHGVRFVDDSFATRFTYDPVARTETAKSWTQAKSLDSYIFGAETVKEAIAVEGELRRKLITDYGRSHGLAWYSLLGHAIMWDDAANARIIKWDSAA